MSVERMRNFVSQMIAPLRNRVYTMITRAIIEVVKDTDGMQVVKLNLLAGETRSDVERFQNFGFSSNPPVGAECVALAVGGNRDHLIVIVADDRKTRVKNLAKGESVVYTDDGTIIHLKKGGIVQILAATKIDIDVPLVNLSTGTLEKILNGEAFQTLYNAHAHPVVGVGVPTGTPVIPSTSAQLSSKVKAGV